MESQLSVQLAALPPGLCSAIAKLLCKTPATCLIHTVNNLVYYHINYNNAERCRFQIEISALKDIEIFGIADFLNLQLYQANVFVQKDYLPPPPSSPFHYFPTIYRNDKFITVQSGYFNASFPLSMFFTAFSVFLIDLQSRWEKSRNVSD